MNKIPVYIITHNPCENLKRILSDDLFNVIIYKCPDKVNLIEGIHDNYCCEYDSIINVLNMSKKDYPLSDCIIMKESTTTILPPKLLAKYVRKIIQRKDYDIFYLSYWLDKCHLYKDSEILDTGIKINRTYCPGGVQSVIIKPSLRDIILKHKTMCNGKYLELKSECFSILLSNNIEEGNIIAKNTTPPLMTFDINHCSCDEDYFKLDLCQSVKKIEQNSYIKWIILLGLSIFIALLVLLLFFIQRRK